jgi:glycosyltransferase involved in cell wall biosynthesis
LRIALLDPHLKGGGQVRYLTNLASELVRRGHAVLIGCRRESVLIDSARIAGCEAAPVFSFRGGLRPVAWFNDISAMRKIIRDFRPDIVHVNGSQDHWTAAVANALESRASTLVRTRHNTYKVSDGLANRMLNRRYTDYQIVVCETVRATLAAQRAFDADRMCSIHNGVDAELFAPDAKARAVVRAEYGYGQEHIVCGIAARLTPAKGHEFLFQALAQIRKARPMLRVLVLGQGVLDAQLKELASKLGISNKVTFAGFRNDIHRCVQAFDIGIQPSIDCDTSSFSLKEQMAAETAVIASDYGGLTEIVSDGVEGLIVPAGSADPLAQAMANLSCDSGLRRIMGMRGRERVLREFTVQVFAERTENAYREAIRMASDRPA